MGKSNIPFQKRSFLKNAGFFASAGEKNLNNFKSKIFPTKNSGKISTPKPAPKSEPEPTVFATPKPTKQQTNKS